MRTLQTGSIWTVLGVLFVGCAGSDEPTDRKVLEKNFEAEYGVRPLENITEIRCKTVWVGDSWRQWTRFTLDETTLQHMLDHGFTRADPGSLKGSEVGPLNSVLSWSTDNVTENPNAPLWRKVPGVRNARVYYKEGHRTGLYWYKYIWIDDHAKLVYAESATSH
jgi:hypothetical protein